MLYIWIQINRGRQLHKKFNIVFYFSHILSKNSLYMIKLYLLYTNSDPFLFHWLPGMYNMIKLSETLS